MDNKGVVHQKSLQRAVQLLQRCDRLSPSMQSGGVMHQ